MLRYLATGFRQFGVFPMPCNERVNWEFYAVVRGRIGALRYGEEKPSLKQKHLWVFPPEISHGWVGEGSRKAQIVAFHFSSVPLQLEKVVREKSFLSVDLNEAEAQRLLEIEEELRMYYQRLTSLNELYFQKALLELTLLAMKNIPLQTLAPLQDTAMARVEAAMTWFSQHITEQPKLEQVARGVHISSSHLRRLFHQVNKESPQAIFTRLKIEQAMQLMSRGDDKLDVISASCGFSSAVSFCRAFKAFTQVTPDVWRKTRLKPYSNAEFAKR